MINQLLISINNYDDHMTCYDTPDTRWAMMMIDDNNDDLI